MLRENKHQLPKGLSILSAARFARNQINEQSNIAANESCHLEAHKHPWQSALPERIGVSETICQLDC